MIVDLVRNDLAKSAITGSVKVDELFWHLFLQNSASNDFYYFSHQKR